MISKQEFQKQFNIFKKTDGQRFIIKEADKWPILNQNDKNTKFDKHYIYHTAWAARKLKKLSPIKHVDISSLLYFSVMVSAFVPIDFYDYRPASVILDNFKSSHADLTKLPFSDNSIQSLSCMHVIEHIGLGRYGDALDINGDLKAISELKRVISKNGYLLFVVPIGRIAKIRFNAHRVYSYNQIISQFSEFKLEEFSLISMKETNGIIVNATEAQVNEEDEACGCFLFKKEK